MVTDRQFSINDGATPTWVTEFLFEDLLRKEISDFSRLLKCLIKYVNNYKADNFLSIKTEFETKDGKRRVMGFILKTASIVNNEKILPFLNESNLDQENFIHFEVLPKFKIIYEEESKSKTFHPTVFKFPQEVPENYILYEDLQFKGYRPIQNGLNAKQMEIVLENLAAFHAASGLHSKFKFNKANTLQKNSNKHLEILSNRIFHENLRSYDLKHYEDKIKSLQSHFLEEQSFTNPLEFQVLQLGNCSMDNMLFHIDAFGKIKDFVFTNMNMCSYGSPVKDLLYLLLSSSIIGDKVTKFDYYIKYYHDQLVAHLNLLKFKGKVPKLSELHYEVIRSNRWAFEAVTQVLPLALWDSNNLMELNLSLDELTNRDQLLKVIYAQKDYCLEIQNLLSWMENKGFLEV
ncbi:uncharacterized protein LOC142237982 [Haematobia irritans]|uniref:uncharacterized protein LOC142237982 n=1 Tax=Haematobia irritans TaxID=7368 RepID=UPI003F509ACC